MKTVPKEEQRSNSTNPRLSASFLLTAFSASSSQLLSFPGLASAYSTKKVKVFNYERLVDQFHFKIYKSILVQVIFYKSSSPPPPQAS